MITLQSIRHDVAGSSLFNGLSLSLSDKKYGLVGPNGVGKTTLAKIIAGEIHPSAGVVISKESVLYFAQTESRDDRTVSEYLMEIWELPTNCTDLISSLVDTLNFDRKLTQLSGGEWMKARLAKAISKSPGFFILDEPSNDLDRSGKEVIVNFLKTYQGGLLLISHDRELLEQVDAILELSNQGISLYGGNFDFYWNQRTAEREKHADDLDELKRLSKKTERERAKYVAQQDKRMRDGAARVPKEGLPKIISGGRKRQAEESIGKIKKQEREFTETAHSKVEDSLSELKADPFLRLNFAGAKAPAGKTIVSMTKLNWKFSEATEPLWKNPIDLTVQGSQRWHIEGKNGSGKSTLIKLITGSTSLEGTLSGDLKINSKAIGYLNQSYSSLDKELSILENIQLNTRFTTTELRNELAFYNFTADSVFQKTKTLSGGELLKASLAQIFLAKQIPELIILDEPTNNLDIPSQELLEKALNNFQGVILLISHDQEFTKKIKTTHSIDLDDL